MRPSGRRPDQLRDIRITRNYTKHAEGSVLIEFGDTRVICNVSVDEKVPNFLKGKGQGWVTAEYGMLPRSTGSRMHREAASGKQGGRTMEIQRLIGRALRSAVNMKQLGERTFTVDCDVIQADGGTRTASITGGCVALVDAINHLRARKLLDYESAAASGGLGVHRHLRRRSGAGPRLRRGLQRRDRHELRDGRRRRLHRNPGHRRMPDLQLSRKCWR